MRILHVVTLVTPDGSFGGPVRVATSQAAQLTADGHDVTIVAGAQGFSGRLPNRFDGANVLLFPAQRVVPFGRFASLSSPAMTKWLRFNVERFDVVHLHLARDLVMLPAARVVRRSGVPYIVQPHGMIRPDGRTIVRIMDRVQTVPVLRKAAAIASLVEDEDRALRAVAGSSAPIRRLLNGVIALDGAQDPASAPRPSEVLYLARIHARKRPLSFVDAAIRVAPKHPDVKFTMVGPDGGQLEQVHAAVENAPAVVRSRIRIQEAVPPEAVRARMAECSIYVLPAVDEPFGLTVVEAMSQGRPVVVTNTCGLAEAIVNAEAGLVVDDSVESLTDAIDYLLSREAERSRMGANAARLAAKRYSIKSVVDALMLLYAEALASRKSASRHLSGLESERR